MSYSELDAWIEEKARGDWPFERWSIGSLPLREGFDYFMHPYRIGAIGTIHYRLLQAYGSANRTSEHLRSILDEAIAVTESAIENSDSDAFNDWLYQEVWLPVLDDALNGIDSPADMLSQSIDYVGTYDKYSERELFSALGLWLVGEYQHLPQRENFQHAAVLIQLAVALSSAEYGRGLEEGAGKEASKVSKRNRVGSDARHAANRERTTQAEAWWKSQASGRLSQAEAARHIARQFHVVEAVAKRWVQQFKRKAEKT